MPALETRQTGYYCYDTFGNIVSCNSAWYDWGRWVALAVVVVGFIVIFFLFSCISARRRRRRGVQPLYGTGWTGRTPFGHGPATYNPQYGQHQQTWQQQPTYGAGPQGGQQGGYYGYPPQQQQHGQHAPPAYDPANRGYFGGEGSTTPSTGVYEMQPPGRVHQAPEVTGAKH